MKTQLHHNTAAPGNPAQKITHIEIVSAQPDMLHRTNGGKFMRRFLIPGAILALAGCATMAPPPLAATAPATPVFFQPYSVALDKPALDAIAAAAVAANQQPESRVLVLGAADSGGNTQANILLSKTRARVVADQLIADGVGPSRIHASGLGEQSALEASAQSARRVLIRIEG